MTYFMQCDNFTFRLTNTQPQFKHELRNTIELYQNNKTGIFIVYIGVCDPKKPRQKLLQGKHIRRETLQENIFIFVKSYKMVVKISFSCDAFCV